MLAVQNLACRRSSRTVFRALGFDLAPGAILLVAGPNGSGKSSLLRVLAGLLEPADGHVFWQGRDIAQAGDAYRAHMLYIGHHDAAKPTLTAAETLAYWQALRGGTAGNISTALASVGLAGFDQTPVRRLSAGQKRRLSLARLALFPADLWLLDEPATALDTQGLALLHDALDRHSAAGGAAIVASHEDLGLARAQLLRMEAT